MVNDPDETLKELLTDARLILATSTDPAVLVMADRVNELHEHITEGGLPPAAWRTSQDIAQDQIRTSQHDQLLLMAWILLQQSDNALRIPYRDLEALEGSQVQRWDDHSNNQIVFTLAHPSKPNLKIVGN